MIIIDEINRGNFSRILGELLFLLEYPYKQVALSSVVRSPGRGWSPPITLAAQGSGTTRR